MITNQRAGYLVRLRSLKLIRVQLVLNKIIICSPRTRLVNDEYLIDRARLVLFYLRVGYWGLVIVVCGDLRLNLRGQLSGSNGLDSNRVRGDTTTET